MSERLRIGADFFDDLATVAAVKAALIEDRRLTEADFADRHATTIRRHYATVAHLEFLEEDARFFASCIWRYLNTLDVSNVRESYQPPAASHPQESAQCWKRIAGGWKPEATYHALTA